MTDTTHDDPWWASYFDDVFLRIYRPLLDRERTAQEVEGIVELAGLEPGAKVLDVACGWGRHAIELAKQGFEVTGVDYSPALIAEAREEARKAGVKVKFLCGDMRKLDYRGEFDVVLSLFSSLGYFEAEEDDVEVLKRMREAAGEEGRLVLETMHRDAIARNYVDRDWWETPAGDHVWVERNFDPVRGISDEILRYRALDGTSGAKPHRIRIRNGSEWRVLLEQAGWKPEEWIGDWELEPYTLHSERLIVVCGAG